MFNPVGSLFRGIASALARFQIIDRARGERIANLTWPRFLTMFARNSQRAADAAMVGLSIGPTAIAGLAFASIFWGVGNGLAGGLAGGTISQVSQRYGAESSDIGLAIKQSIWVGVALAIPFTLVFIWFSDPLIALVGTDPTTIAYGATYLQVLSLAMVFNYLNTISSRTLAGADDTWIAMVVRGSGAFANIVFNAIFIFGLGMGVAGAALGTVVAEVLVTVCFTWGFVSGSLPVVGEFPVEISLAGPHFDRELSTQLLRISPPLMVRNLSRSVAQFPLFALLAFYGPTIVAAFEVGRRVLKLIRTPGSGFSMSASSLVGQELGRGDDPEADSFAWDIIRFSSIVYIVTGGVVVVFAPLIAPLFVQEASAITETVPFIRVAALALLGKGMDATFGGILKAAGDNRWPMYGRFVGQYLVLLPLVYVGTIHPLGVVFVYVAAIAEPWSAAVISGYRFMSGIWKDMGQGLRPNTADD